MTCVIIEDVCKRPTDVKDWAFNWAGETFRYFMLGGEYAAGTRIRPTVANGFEYEAGGNGQTSAKKEPTWPTTLGATVVSGSITFTCVAISTAGLFRSITSSVWEAETGSALTLSGDIFTNSAGNQSTYVKVAGGADDTVFDVVNRVIFSDGVELSAILRVTIDDEAD